MDNFLPRYKQNSFFTSIRTFTVWYVKTVSVSKKNAVVSFSRKKKQPHISEYREIQKDWFGIFNCMGLKKESRVCYQYLFHINSAKHVGGGAEKLTTHISLTMIKVASCPQTSQDNARKTIFFRN